MQVSAGPWPGGTNHGTAIHPIFQTVAWSALTSVTRAEMRTEEVVHTHRYLGRRLELNLTLVRSTVYTIALLHNRRLTHRRLTQLPSYTRWTHTHKLHTTHTSSQLASQTPTIDPSPKDNKRTFHQCAYLTILTIQPPVLRRR